MLGRCVAPARLAIPLALLGLGLAGSARAEDTARAAAGLLADWFASSDAAKEAQPHWITPLVTVTPRLEQEYRYDQSWSDRPKGVTLDNYGGGKGLELIPTLNSELIIGVPAYQVRDTPQGRSSGWADETLLWKYRLAAANEERGNYIVTGFLGLSVPSGSKAFTAHQTLITPTLAAGKGWGTRESGFDIQSTLGIALPTGELRALGRPVTWNTALQGHLGRFWPEVELNYTYFKDGPNDGRSQTALTAGVVAGRFALGRRARCIIGGGFQKAVSSFKTFNHNWLLSARVAF